ncbi:MAG: restriction endonuclease [Chloroflexota bacterium]
MTKMWMVRAGRDSVYAEDFLQGGIVSIGWTELGSIEPGPSRAALEKLYRNAFPNVSDATIRTGVGQLFRFLWEIKPGDRVATYDRDKRLYYLGEIRSEVQWMPEIIEEMPRARKVKWSQRVSRDRLTPEARNSLGAILTLFLVKPSIEDRIVLLDWEQMQQLVAGLLKAMGYRTTVSRRGPDRGYDVFASPDGLGLQEPRIFVGVKHRPTQSIGAQDIRSFLGGRSHGDRCLYVSTGGYTKDARYEADRANIPLQLLGLVDLRQLLVEYYERLDGETRSLLPLKRIYVLAS